jgi:predicted ArsR family transcriptional regulator
MNVLPLLREIVHSPVLDIILHLKRSTGLSVNELCQEMKMSYMGVKQHCVDLEKKRLVDTWRRPKPTGRPEKIYRLTHRLDGLFPQMGNEWTLELLETAEQVFGERAAAKLLFSHFQKRTDRWKKAVRGASLAARVKELAKLRLAEGYLTLVREGEGVLEVTDHHDPCGVVAERFPLVYELDRDSVAEVLGVEVKQTVEEAGGLKRVIHSISVSSS